MKKLGLLMVISLVSFSLMVAALPSGVSAKEIVLNWASFLPKSHPGTKSLQKELFDKINERGKGKLFVRYRGGPETFSSRDLGDAVQKGIVDMASALITFYQSIVTGAGSFKLSPFLPEEERKNGVYDYMAKQHEKYGLKYIGRPNPGKANYFYLFLNKKIEKPEDFKGVRIGAAGAGRPSAMAWGASVVTLKLSEYYTAMERKLVDGINCVPPDAWVAWGIHEKTKYLPDHSYFQGTGMIIANLKSWNKLPPDLQKLIMDVMKEYEIKQIDFEIQKQIKAKKKMQAAGVEIYKLAPDVAKWFVDTAYSSTWAYEEKRFGKVVTDFKKLVQQ